MYPVEYSEGVEISTEKYFFRKVHIILNMFHIYRFFISHIVLELSPFEKWTKNVILGKNGYFGVGSGLQEYTVG